MPCNIRPKLDPPYPHLDSNQEPAD
jgi:hypothetical protein